MKTITKLGLAVILFMATATTNHAQAQTKEETTEWINTYANDLMSRRSVAHTIEKLDENGNITANGETTNLAKDYWIDDIYYIYGRDVNGNENDKIWQLRLTEKHETTNGGFPVKVFYFNNEEDCKRVHKAFLHLAKLLGTKPKPKKDTF